MKDNTELGQTPIEYMKAKREQLKREMHHHLEYVAGLVRQIENYDIRIRREERKESK